MSNQYDVDDIVKDFVDNDLASLEAIGGESESFMLSPNLEQQSTPNLAEEQINVAKRGPQIRKDPESQKAAASETAEKTDATASPSEDDKVSGENTTTKESVSVPISAPVNVPVDGPVITSSSASSSNSPSANAASTSKSERVVSRNANARHASTNSTSTLNDDSKHKGFGERFKSLGKRITSSSKK